MVSLISEALSEIPSITFFPAEAADPAKLDKPYLAYPAFSEILSATIFPASFADSAKFYNPSWIPYLAYDDFFKTDYLIYEAFSEALSIKSYEFSEIESLIYEALFEILSATFFPASTAESAKFDNPYFASADFFNTAYFI